MTRFILALVLLAAASTGAAAQQNVPLYITGTLTPGHGIALVQSGTPGAAVGQDAGPALAGNYTELGITNTGLPLCVRDSPSSSYHLLCLGANALGGGVISYSAQGGASVLPMLASINGTLYQFPFAISGIAGPSSSTIGDFACWNNTIGTLLADCGSGGNTVTTITGSHLVATTDCGNTLLAGTGSTGQFTITFPSTSGFASGCQITIINGDTGRGKTLAGVSPANGPTLWPQQTIAFRVAGGNWQQTLNPSRYVVASPLTLYIDPNNGSATADCLSTGTAACATSAQAMADVAQYMDVENLVTFEIADGSYGSSAAFAATDWVGGGSAASFAIQGGDGSAASNVSIQCNASCPNGSAFSWLNSRGLWLVEGFTMSASSNNLNAMFASGGAPVVDYQNVNFGAFPGTASTHISCIYGGGHFENVGALAISGSAFRHLQAFDACVIHERTGPGTITGTPLLQYFAYAQAGGIIGVTASIYTGSANPSGFQCAAVLNAIVDTNQTYASLPGGSNTCLPTQGGVIN